MSSLTTPVWRRAAIALLPAMALMAACTKKEVQAPAAQPADVSALSVKAQVVPVVFDFVGQTESSQQVEIRARVSGFLEKRVYTEGAFVKPGQVLFLMDSKPFNADLTAAKAELAQQQARLKTARANLARVKPLVAENALAVKDLDDASGQEQAAAAAVEAAAAKVTDSQLKLGYTTITSPLQGLSSFAKVQDGAFVSASNSLLTYVARLDPMRVNFSLSENESLRLKDEVDKGLLTRAPNDDYLVELVLADGSVFPARGRITFADAAFSQETGTFLLRAELPNPQGQLRPGQFVRVNVIGFSRPNAIVVPQRAVQQGPRGAFVWTVDGEQKAQQRPVVAGDWLGDQWLVSSGLKDGERVVVDGFMRLAPGVPVMVKEVAAEPLPQRKVATPAAVAGAGSAAGAGGTPGGGAARSSAASAALGPTSALPAALGSGSGSGAGSSAGSGAASSGAGSGASGGAGSGASGGASSRASGGASSGAGGAAPAPPTASASDKDAVFFDSSHTRIDATARARLLGIAAAMKAQPSLQVTLNGYVDATGNARRNKDLARQRAQAVRDALVAAGVPRERIALQAPANITGGESPALARRVDIALAGAR